MNKTKLEQMLERKANNLRIRSILSTTEAGSGHPTTCLSSAEILSTLFFHAMRYDPQKPKLPNNDRFILSKGHAAPILYAAWAEVGIISPDELLTLRKLESKLEGHPTPQLDWIDVATGSLGQGLSAGVGMAIDGKTNDYRVYVLLGDGETAEGSVWEAIALSSFYSLKNLIGIIDVNGMGQSQRTMYGFDLNSYCQRIEAFGWNAIAVDGHNVGELIAATDRAKNSANRPTMIVAKTSKGKGISFLEGEENWHGKPIPKGEKLELALSELGEIKDDEAIEPEKPPTIERPQPPTIGEVAKPNYSIGARVATRSGYGNVLPKLATANPFVVALDGDTKNSTYAQTLLTKHSDRFFEMFIAEQNLVGVATGMASRGRIPFVSTFAAFLSRANDQMRMASISSSNVKYVGSHCGVSIGEDGASQMGLEDLAMFRALPNSVVLYPSDPVATERLVVEASKQFGTVYVRTSRPKTKVLYSNDEQFPIGGLKILRSSKNDRATVIGAGVTLHEALEAYEILKLENIKIRVIDLYSVKPIDAETLMDSAIDERLITVEDHRPEGGIGEAVLSAVAETKIRVYKLAVAGIPRSGKPEELLAMHKIDANSIVQKVKMLLA